MSCELAISRQLFKSDIAFYDRIMTFYAPISKQIYRVEGLRPSSTPLAPVAVQLGALENNEDFTTSSLLRQTDA